MKEGSGAALDFLRGHACGLFGKIVFGTAFALLVPQLGVRPAMLLACGCAVLGSTIRQPAASVIFRP